MRQPSELPGGTVTFLSSALPGEESSAAQHVRAVAGALAEHGGFEVDGAPGSVVSAFASPRAALAAAADLLAGRTGGAALRVGLHTGEATPGANGYANSAVEHTLRVLA